MFLTSFSYYRGIAIVLIVIGHCYGLSGWTFTYYPERDLANILTGGTVLFVFISGFLFHQVFYPGFDFRWFLTKKTAQGGDALSALVHPDPGTESAHPHAAAGPVRRTRPIPVGPVALPLPSRQSRERGRHQLLPVCLLCGTFSPGCDTPI